MNKRNYLNKILELCTEKQRDLFSRMYPTGVEGGDIAHATLQLENTLKRHTATDEELSSIKRELEAIETKTSLEVLNTAKLLADSQNSLQEAYNLIERLKNPINIENNDVQERLALLDALEAGGVDNWVFYDASISAYEE